MWRRRCTKYAEFIEEAEIACFEGRSRWTSSNLGVDTAFERTIDTNELVRSFKRLSHQANSLITVIQGRILVGIGKQSVIEAHRVTRLTVVALVFLPLSFVASLLHKHERSLLLKLVRRSQEWQDRSWPQVLRLWRLQNRLYIGFDKRRTGFS